MVYAIILAGGIGTRSGEAIPKQCVEVGGKAVLVHTIQAFEDCKMIDKIIVATLPNYINTIWHYRTEFNFKKIYKVVQGGATGIGSVYSGLLSIKDEALKEDIVSIHDGVRPFVSKEIISDSIKKAMQYGTGVASIPCVETMVRWKDGTPSSDMIARDELYRVQTPQTFTAGILYDLFDTTDDITKIQEPSVFAYYISQGGAVYCSLGSEKNIKLTYPEDIAYYRRLFG